MIAIPRGKNSVLADRHGLDKDKDSIQHETGCADVPREYAFFILVCHTVSKTIALRRQAMCSGIL